jgi:excisionase family DNA binding protein
MSEPLYLTRDEAAKRARVSTRTIDRALRSGELQHVGGGGFAVRIRPEWVDEWLERRSGRYVSASSTTS